MMKLKSFRRGLIRSLLKNPGDLAYHLCRGKGLEIGAMSAPYPFSFKCQVFYADIMSSDDLRKSVDNSGIPDLYKGEFVNVDFVLNPPRFGLEELASGSFDFVYSSNVLEHTTNPIYALMEQIRVVRTDGVIYVAIPNKWHTYDRERKATPMSDFEYRYLNSIFHHSIEEARDVIMNTQKHPLYDRYKENPHFYAREMVTSTGGLHHFFVFDPKNTNQLVQFMLENSHIELLYFSAIQNRDIQFAFRKK